MMHRLEWFSIWPCPKAELSTEQAKKNRSDFMGWRAER